MLLVCDKCPTRPNVQITNYTWSVKQRGRKSSRIEALFETLKVVKQSKKLSTILVTRMSIFIWANRQKMFDSLSSHVEGNPQFVHLSVKHVK